MIRNRVYEVLQKDHSLLSSKDVDKSERHQFFKITKQTEIVYKEVPKWGYFRA